MKAAANSAIAAPGQETQRMAEQIGLRRFAQPVDAQVQEGHARGKHS